MRGNRKSLLPGAAPVLGKRVLEQVAVRGKNAEIDGSDSLHGDAQTLAGAFIDWLFACRRFGR
jgi:hypothetical protein